MFALFLLSSATAAPATQVDVTLSGRLENHSVYSSTAGGGGLELGVRHGPLRLGVASELVRPIDDQLPEPRPEVVDYPVPPRNLIDRRSSTVAWFGGGTDLHIEGAVSGRIGIGADLGVGRVRTRVRSTLNEFPTSVPTFTSPAGSRLGLGARLRVSIPLVPRIRLTLGTRGLAWRQDDPRWRPTSGRPSEARWFGRMSVSTGMQWRFGAAATRL